LLSKQMLPTQLKLRSSDTISLQSTWHSATRACLIMIPQIKRKPLSTMNSLPVGARQLAGLAQSPHGKVAH
jgi:hypothetical protein